MSIIIQVFKNLKKKLKTKTMNNNPNTNYIKRKFSKSPSHDKWIETNSKKNNNNNRIRLEAKPIEESKRNVNLGASSLVQIWEARLNRSNGGNSPSSGQSTVSSSRNDSGVSVQDSHISDSELADGTVEIESGSQHCLVCDSGESKWGRVADIVKRLSNEEKNLTAGNNGGGGGLAIIRTPRPCTSLCSSLSSEKSSFPVVNFSPRIGGRQSFINRNRQSLF